jgi:NTP pyrophosphatase (non-canonical NTP hydrolase)
MMDDHLKHRKMLEVELADCIIRILDMAGLYNLDVAGAIAEKHEYNAKRADHKKENRQADGGKKF